jgi:16S rRNA (cytosine967-C5)-methyltransferase
VKLAKKRGFRNLSGFVNGVLRSVIRNEKDIIYPDEEKESKLFLSVVYSVPEWLVNQFLEQYDYSAVKKMLDTTFLEKKTTIRCNLNQITTIELMKMLHAQNVTVEPGAYLPYALKISGYDYLNQLEAFQKGYFQVQDESSMLVGAVSGVKEHDYVIDVCAAPGGKSLHIAELLKSTGKVSSRDVSEKKTSLILENRNRLGYTNLDVTVQDALEFDQESVNRADIVIADLPCSGLGVIDKKPDIKYNMTKEKQLELVNLQRNILSVIQQYVKKNGILLYSTCTINQKENIENVQWFIKHYDFKLESLNPFLPAELQNDTSGEGYLQLVPGIHDTDGFFIARLRKY